MVLKFALGILTVNFVIFYEVKRAKSLLVEIIKKLHSSIRTLQSCAMMLLSKKLLEVQNVLCCQQLKDVHAVLPLEQQLDQHTIGLLNH